LHGYTGHFDDHILAEIRKNEHVGLLQLR